MYHIYKYDIAYSKYILSLIYPIPMKSLFLGELCMDVFRDRKIFTPIALYHHIHIYISLSLSLSLSLFFSLSLYPHFLSLSLFLSICFYSSSSISPTVYQERKKMEKERFVDF